MDHFRSPCHDHISVALLDQTRHEPGPSNDIETERSVDLNQFSLLDRLPGRVDESIRGTYQWNNLDNARVHTVPNTTQGQDTLTEHDQDSWTGMCLNDRSWPATSRDVDPAVLHQFAWPYNAHEMSDSLSMSRRTPSEYIYNQSSSILLTPELFQNDPIMAQDVSLPNLNIRPSTSQLLGYRFPGDTVCTGQEKGQELNAVDKMIDVEDAVTRIGSVLNNGKFVCDDERCAGRTFARQAELKRHHTTLHAIDKPNFWCHVSPCPRSTSAGGEAFHRKDKLMAHVRNMHPDAQQGYP